MSQSLEREAGNPPPKYTQIMPKKLTKKQKSAQARCRTCDRDLGRLRNEQGMGVYECCCKKGFCLFCCPGDEEE